MEQEHIEKLINEIGVTRCYDYMMQTDTDFKKFVEENNGKHQRKYKNILNN